MKRFGELFMKKFLKKFELKQKKILLGFDFIF